MLSVFETEIENEKIKTEISKWTHVIFFNIVDAGDVSKFNEEKSKMNSQELSHLNIALNFIPDRMIYVYYRMMICLFENCTHIQERIINKYIRCRSRKTVKLLMDKYPSTRGIAMFADVAAARGNHKMLKLLAGYPECLPISTYGILYAIGNGNSDILRDQHLTESFSKMSIGNNLEEMMSRLHISESFRLIDTDKFNKNIVDYCESFHSKTIKNECISKKRWIETIRTKEV